jgi:hypothetical protein
MNETQKVNKWDGTDITVSIYATTNFYRFHLDNIRQLDVDKYITDDVFKITLMSKKFIHCLDNDATPGYKKSDGILFCNGISTSSLETVERFEKNAHENVNFYVSTDQDRKISVEEAERQPNLYVIIGKGEPYEHVMKRPIISWEFNKANENTSSIWWYNVSLNIADRAFFFKGDLKSEFVKYFILE